ncbi:MAG TPA: CBS domain-containing protein [Pseudogracilibacillus sp.]|nr:CBS domain-containing protein [Pseudogracilibacillus sp.]
MLDVRNWEECTYYLLVNLQNENKSKFRAEYFQLHRNDQLRFFETITDNLRPIFYKFIEAKEFAPNFAKLSISKQREVIEEVNEAYELTMIENLPSDEVVNFLKQVKPDEVVRYLRKFTSEKAEQVKMLLSYKQGTAGALMTTEFVTASKDETIKSVLARLFETEKDSETIYYIYVVSESNKLVGVVSLYEMMLVPSGHTMDFVMKKQVVSVSTVTDEQEVVRLVKDYDLLLIPVVNEYGQLIGIITVDDVMDIDENRKGDSRKESLKKWPYLFMTATLMSGIIFSVIMSFAHFSVDYTSRIVVFTLIISIIAGLLSTQSSVMTMNIVAEKKYRWKGILIALKENEFIVTFIYLAIVGALSGLVSLSFIEHNQPIGFVFAATLFLAIISSVLIGTLIPFVLQEFKLNSKQATVIANILVTSFICSFVAWSLFYIMS